MSALMRWSRRRSPAATRFSPRGLFLHGRRAVVERHRMLGLGEEEPALQQHASQARQSGNDDRPRGHEGYDGEREQRQQQRQQEAEEDREPPELARMLAGDGMAHLLHQIVLAGMG